MNLQNSGFLGAEEKPKLDDFLRMSDVASQLRQLQDKVGEQLDIDQQRDVLRETLLKAAEESKEKLTTEQVDAAIESFYADRYSFKAPHKSFETTLANLYIARKKITAVAGTLAAVTAFSWAATTAISSAHISSLERGVERAIEQEYRERVELGETLKGIVSSPFRKQLPQNEQDKLTASITTSEGRLKESDKILNDYCPNGSAKKAVTQDNFEEVKKQIPILESILAPVSSQINEGVRIIETQKQFVSTKQSLDSLIGEIRNSKPLPVLLQKAETAYSNGATCVDNRQLSGAQTYQKQLTTLQQDIVSFSSLTGDIERLYSNIKAVAKEDEAKVKGEKVYQEAKQFAQAVDVAKLRQSVAQLEELDVVLNEEYNLIIVGGDIRAGMGYNLRDVERNPELGIYCLLVEARDPRGKAISTTIFDEDKKGKVNVLQHGESVELSTFERVKGDKNDNDVIDNSLFGRKEKGYLNEKIIFPVIARRQYSY